MESSRVLLIVLDHKDAKQNLEILQRLGDTTFISASVYTVCIFHICV